MIFPSGYVLVFPNRLACLLLRLISGNSDVLELEIVHLQELFPLPGALTVDAALVYIETTFITSLFMILHS
jgi:hypothetical protein